MILEKIKLILSEQLSIDQEEIEAATRFDELGADSLDVVELVMAMEEEFDITIEDEQVEKISTIEDIVKIISEYVEE